MARLRSRSRTCPRGSRPRPRSWPLGGTRRKALAVAAATGAVEPPAAFLAYGAASVAAVVLPLGLAFAAGAMLYVVVDELIPESHARLRARRDGLLAVGFTLMMFLDNVFS